MGLLVQALVEGAELGLLVLGFWLIREVTGSLNFAHGAFVVLGAYFAWRLQVALGIPPALGVAVVALAMFALGYLLQYLGGPTMRRQPPFMRILATFGLGLLIQGLLTFLFTDDYRSLKLGSRPLLGFPALTLGSVAAVAMCLVASVLVLNLWTGRLGVVMAAVGHDRRIPQTLGIRPRRIEAVAAGLGVACAGVAGVAVGMTGAFHAPDAGHYTVICALVVVWVGLRDPLRVIGAAYLLAVADTLARAALTPGETAGLALLVLVVMLLIRVSRAGERHLDPAQPAGVGHGSGGHPRATHSLSAAPAVTLVLAVAGIAAALLPELSPSLLTVATESFMFVTLALSWAIVGGLAGYASFGQVVFFGMGGYAAALLMVRASLSFWFALPLATASSCAAAILVGPLMLRLRREYFALATLLLAAAAGAAATSLENATGGPTGMVITTVGFHRPTTYLGGPGFYLTFLVLATGAVLIFTSLRRSGLGAGLKVIRENEEIAGECGVPTTLVKVAAFGIAGLLSGAAGAVYAFKLVTVTPAGVFSSSLTVLPIAMVVLGGLDSVIGTVIGAVAVETLSYVLDSHLHQASTFVLGMLVLAATLSRSMSLSGVTRLRSVRGRATAIRLAR